MVSNCPISNAVTPANASADRAQFSARLHTLLTSLGQPATPSSLALAFNRHFQGAPVTMHAARKWLVGGAIPTQAKLRALAQLVGVSPEWLRYGAPGAAARTVPAIIDADLQLIADLARLDGQQRRMVHELIRMLALQQGGTGTGR